MNKTNIFVMIVVGVLIAYNNPSLSRYLPQITFPNNTPDAPVVPTPEVDTNAVPKALAAIKKMLGGSADGKLIGDHFASLAEITKDDKMFKTTGAIRLNNTAVAKYLFEGAFKGKYPTLKENLDIVMLNGISEKNVILDKELREKAVSTLQSIAKACYGE